MENIRKGESDGVLAKEGVGRVAEIFKGFEDVSEGGEGSGVESLVVNSVSCIIAKGIIKIGMTTINALQSPHDIDQHVVVSEGRLRFDARTIVSSAHVTNIIYFARIGNAIATSARLVVASTHIAHIPGLLRVGQIITTTAA